MKFLEFLSEGVNDPAIFKVVFLAGGPGSGKSFMAKKTGLQSMGFVTINSDDAFEHMMRKGGLDFKMPESEKHQRDAVRDVAKATTNKKQDLALQGRLGLVIDGTGKDFDKIQKLKDKLEKIGYDSSMLFINTDLKTALDRNAKRDRSVPEDMAKQLWTDVQNNIGKFQQEFGGQFHVVDNSEGADFESQTNTAFKNIAKWTKEKPKNPVAKEWIKSQTTLVPVLKDTKPAETPAPAAQASSAPAPAASTPAPQQASAPAAAPAAAPAPQGNAADGTPRDSSQGTGVYHIKMSKKGETNLKVTTIKAQNEEEALKIVRSHGYVPLEINHRTVTQRVGESIEKFSTFVAQLDESACDFISAQQLKDLEKFGDRLLQKFNIDVEFTKHFGERMSDSRNKPCIKVAELQSLFKKIGKDKGTKIKQHADHEAVLKDLQSDLNLPFVAKPTKDGEIELVLKTIMRKKDFKSPDPEVHYESYEDVCPECNAYPCQCAETISEGRPSQRHPLEGHPYHSKTDAELTYIGKDAHRAAQAMRGHNTDAENKYMDQANDSATVRYWRQKNGTPAWYKKKYGLKEETVSEGAPIVVMPRADRLKKPEPIKVRYQGDIVPPAPPVSTEKRGVKGRPGQRPMPDHSVKEEVSIPLYMQEAAYAGNIGMMELVKFYQKSTDAEKKHLQDLIKKGMSKEAWKLVQDKTGVKLVGKEFHEETELAEFFGISAKDKGHIQHVASQVSDVPGHWDHKKHTFTDKGHAELHKRLNGNQKHIKYAKSLTHKDYEAESFKEDVAMAANAVAHGGVDMNPTGVGKWDKRSKFHINHMFRRADGTKYGKGRVLKEKE